MDNSHDESQCEALHEATTFTIRLYSASKGSREFEAWYKDVFCVENMPHAEDFEFKPYFPSAEEEMLEVTQHCPFFSIDTLEYMFERYRENGSFATSSTEGKVLSIKSGRSN